MLTIRPIADDELPAFLALQPDPELAADQAAYVERMFAAGAMRPEWCYVATDSDRVVGRFAFWSLPKWMSRSHSSWSTSRLWTGRLNVP